jgi:hypothetical protein
LAMDEAFSALTRVGQLLRVVRGTYIFKDVE